MHVRAHALAAPMRSHLPRTLAPAAPRRAQHGGQGAPGMCIPSSLGRGGALPAWLLALLIVASVVAVSGARGLCWGMQ